MRRANAYKLYTHRLHGIEYLGDFGRKLAAGPITTSKPGFFKPLWLAINCSLQLLISSSLDWICGSLLMASRRSDKYLASPDRRNSYKLVSLPIVYIETLTTVYCSIHTSKLLIFSSWGFKMATKILGRYNARYFWGLEKGYDVSCLAAFWTRMADRFYPLGSRFAPRDAWLPSWFRCRQTELDQFPDSNKRCSCFWGVRCGQVFSLMLMLRNTTRWVTSPFYLKDGKLAAKKYSLHGWQIANFEWESIAKMKCWIILETRFGFFDIICLWMPLFLPPTPVMDSCNRETTLIGSAASR